MAAFSNRRKTDERKTPSSSGRPPSHASLRGHWIAFRRDGRRVRRVTYYGYIRESAHYIDMNTVILMLMQVYRYSYGLVRPMGVVQAITLRVEISLFLINAEVGTYRVAKSREDITFSRELLVHSSGPDLQKAQNSS